MAAPRVFVSHSHQDDAFTRRLVDDLKTAGADVWVDVAGVGADDFQKRINQALAACEWFVLVLSPDALKSPWVEMEVHAGIRLKVQGRIQAIIQILAEPVNQADIPPTWGTFNHFDATRDYTAARDRVLSVLGLSPLPDTPPRGILISQQPAGAPSVHALPQASQMHASPLNWLDNRLAALGFEGRTVQGIQVILPPLCDVPAGEFLIGSDVERDKTAREFGGDLREFPQHRLTLPAFQIGRYPVTVGEYACAVHAKAVREPPNAEHYAVSWHTQFQRKDHPVVCITWPDALAYVRWLAETTGEPWRLPSEAEWEKAARGDDGRLFPWGDQWDEKRANTREGGLKSTSPVGFYADRGDGSPYGVHDLTGNVHEWTSSMLKPYPYTPGDGRENLDYPDENRVQRGGSWVNGKDTARSAYRLDLGLDPFFDATYGFRLALSPTGS